MIRRDAPAGQAAEWILISQIDHARAAGALAEHWGSGDFAPLFPRDELAWAISHHDDGWLEWDQAPGIDPQNGRPRSFLEMELEDSLGIWSASIENAGRVGPLQGSVVAGHFCLLARRASAWLTDIVRRQQVDGFLTEFKALRTAWLADWQSQNAAANTAQRADLALTQLQFFDVLSLWFCCAWAIEPEEVPTPAGPVLKLTPRDAQRVELAPWPLTVGGLNLEVHGRSVPVGHYADRWELAAAASQPIVLRWQLQPAGQER
jgi:hypothetical protein